MYKRYENDTNDIEANDPIQPRGNDLSDVKPRERYIPPPRERAPRQESRRHNEHNHRDDYIPRENMSENAPPQEEQKQPDPKPSKNPLLSFIPTSVYNPETGKILGFLSAEDLLLIALILMFLDNDEEDNNLTVYALLYVLVSEWIDIDFSKFL